MISSKLPKHPWERIATDLLELNKKQTLATYRLYMLSEVIKLSSTTSKTVITAMKSVFSQHSILQTMINDNGPQWK